MVGVSIRWSVFLLGLMVLIFGDAAPARALERVFYYREGKEARASLLAHYPYIDILAPQSYAADDSGALSGAIDQTVLDFALKHKIKVMPLLVNQHFSRERGAALLDNPSKQDALIAALIAEAKQRNFWGWQLDFEQLDADYRERYNIFAAKFGASLRQNGLVSSVAVIGQISENPADYKRELWQKVIGVYDYAALAERVDFISVMAYDDPESSGPVARYPWWLKVLGYSLSRVPAEKISLGLGLYYWQWDQQTGKRIGIGGWEGINNVLKKYNPTQSYSRAAEAPHLDYTKQGQRYRIWFENWQSVAKKVGVIKALELRGFSAWALGLEVPSVFRSLGQNIKL